MSLSNAIDPVPVDDAAPVVEVIETSFEEVSPAPPRFADLRRKLVLALKIMGILAAILAYPVMVVVSHNVDDRPVDIDMTVWSAREVGAVSTLLTRELDGPGLAADRANWHPQARLVALPAWQKSLTSTLSDWLGSRAGEGETADPDLASATRLTMNDEPGTEMTPKLQAAIEALARFDGRVANDLAAPAGGREVLVADLRRFADLAALSQVDLSIQVAERSDWPASKVDIRTYYAAKARAHVAHVLLTAGGQARQAELISVGLSEEWSAATALWARAASQKPVFVTNQSGDSLFQANHLAVMSFYLAEAEAASRALADALEVAEYVPRAPSELAELISSP